MCLCTYKEAVTNYIKRFVSHDLCHDVANLTKNIECANPSTKDNRLRIEGENDIATFTISKQESN